MMSEVKSVTGNVGEVESAAESARNVIVDRVAEIEAKLKMLVAKLAMATKATESASKSTEATSAAAATEPELDGVKLSVAQSAWLVDKKLNVVLAFVYPEGDKVRVGLGGKLYELAKGAPKRFRFDGKRCQISFVGMSGGKAVISHACGS